MVIARFVGTGVIADAYNSTYLFTGNFFVLLGGLNGPVDSATLSILSDKGETERDAALRKILFATIKTFGFLTIVGYLIAPLLVPLMAMLYQPRFESNLSPSVFSGYGEHRFNRICKREFF